MADAYRRYGALAGMYLTQGITAGFGGWVLLPNLAAHGVSMEAQAGFLASGSVPWILKGVWAPFLDKIGGTTGRDPRKIAAVAQLLVAASLLAMAASGDVVGNISWLVWAWVLQNTMLSIQDVTADTLALDVLPASERGRGNGVMLGSRMLGSEVVGPRLLGVGVLVASLEGALWLEAAIVAGLAVVPLLAPWHPGERQASLREPLGPRLAAAFLQPRVRGVAILAALVFLADVVTGAVASNFAINHLGWTPAEYAQRLTLPALIFGLGGYVLGIGVADRLGHGRTAAVGSLGLGVTWLVFGLLEAQWASPDLVVVMVAVQVLWTALLYIGVHAALMDHTDPRVRATQFVIFMALLNLPRLYGAAMAPGLLEALGYAGLFVVAGAYQIAMGLVLPQLQRPAPGPG